MGGWGMVVYDSVGWGRVGSVEWDGGLGRVG